MSYTLQDDIQLFADAVVSAINNEDVERLRTLAQVAKGQGFNEDAEDIMNEVEKLSGDVIPDKVPAYPID